MNLKTVDIKGKQYVTVNERLKYFRSAEIYTGWSLISDIVSNENDTITIKASAIDEKGTVRATGIASEDKGTSFINKTSYVENCETSAWGRALANLGIGIDTDVASGDELNRAEVQKEINKQSKEKIDKVELVALREMIEEIEKMEPTIDESMICSRYDVSKLSDLTKAEWVQISKKLDATRVKLEKEKNKI